MTYAIYPPPSYKGATQSRISQTFVGLTPALAAAGEIAGTCTLGFAAGASALTGAGALAGTCAITTVTTTSVLRGTGALVGTAAEVFAEGTSTLRGAGVLAGSAANIFGAGSSTILGAGALAGSAAGVFGAGSSAILGAGALAGTASITLVASAGPSAALIGSADLVFAAGSSTLTGIGTLAGTAAEFFGGTAPLLGSGALAGTSANVFDAQAAPTGEAAAAVVPTVLRTKLPPRKVYGPSRIVGMEPALVEVTLAWDDTATDEGYRVKWGQASGVYTQSADKAQNVCFHNVFLPYSSTWYFTVVELIGGVEQTPAAEIKAIIDSAGNITWVITQASLPVAFAAGTSTLRGAGVLAGTAALALVGSATGTATGLNALAGTAGAVFGAGSSTLLGAGALAGTAAVTLTGAAASSGTVQIAGTAAILSGGSATLLGAGALAGSSALVLTGTALPEAPGVMQGSAAGVFGGQGVLLGAGRLAGAAVQTIIPAAVITGRVNIAGTAAIAVTQAADLKGSGRLAGTAAVTITQTGTIKGWIGGLCSISLGGSGTLKGSGVLAGVVSLTFTTRILYAVPITTIFYTPPPFTYQRPKVRKTPPREMPRPPPVRIVREAPRPVPEPVPEPRTVTFRAQPGRITVRGYPATFTIRRATTAELRSGLRLIKSQIREEARMANGLQPLNYQARANGKKELNLYLYDVIGNLGFEQGISPKQIVDDIAAAGSSLERINVHINSPGGSVFDGNTIYSTLAQSGKNVVVYVDGLAGSIASVIAMAGEERILAENAIIMIHRATTPFYGNAEEMRKQADVLDMVERGIVNAYRKRTKKSEEQIKKWMTDTTYFDAKDALSHGFGTVIAEGQQAVNCAIPQSLVPVYRNMPKSLRDAAMLNSSRPRDLAARRLGALTEKLPELLKAGKANDPARAINGGK